MEWVITTPEAAIAVLQAIPHSEMMQYSHEDMCHVKLYRDLETAIPMIKVCLYEALDQVDYYINGELL